MMTGSYKFLNVPCGELLEVIESISTAKCSGFNQIFKSANEGAVLNRVYVKHRDTGLRRFVPILIMR